MANYVDICIIPIQKKNLASYKKNTAKVGKILLKHGALSSSDFVAEDENATRLIFPKKIKLREGEVFIIAMAEFKSKAHRSKVFKLMEKDPAMEKIMGKDYMDHKRMIMGGFTTLVNLKK